MFTEYHVSFLQGRDALEKEICRKAREFNMVNIIPNSKNNRNMFGLTAQLETSVICANIEQIKSSKCFASNRSSPFFFISFKEIEVGSNIYHCHHGLITEWASQTSQTLAHWPKTSGGT